MARRVRQSPSSSSAPVTPSASAAAGDRFRAQHGDLTARVAVVEGVAAEVLMDEAESPLLWLARRKGKDGQPMIAPAQLMAGERLRADVTRAQMLPRVTANWSIALPAGQRGQGAGAATDAALAAQQSVRRALAQVGPEFSGLLLDVCCFLKRLEDIERERGWPVRSAKVVLQLGLDRLARHYGYDEVQRGAPKPEIAAWSADRG